MYNTNINTAHAESSAVDYSPHISRYLCVQQHNCRWTRVVGSPVITGDDGCPYYFSAVVVSWLATAIFTSALIHRERERERENISEEIDIFFRTPTHMPLCDARQASGNVCCTGL
jgi:hypothetical protein